MNMHEYQAQFNQFLFAEGLERTLPIEEVWRHFQDTLRDGSDDAMHNEFTFDIGYGGHTELIRAETSIKLTDPNPLPKIISHNYKDIFLVYFGRRPHASNSTREWSVGDIEYRFYYEMNEELHTIAEKHEGLEIVGGYCTSEPEEIISQKIEAFIAQTNERSFIWNAIRDLKPAKTYFQCWLL